VNYSFCLLTLSWMAAGPTDVPATPSGAGGAAAPVNAPVVTQVQVVPQTLSLRDRIRQAFGLPPRATTYQTVPANVIIQPAKTTEPPVITQSVYAVNVPVTTQATAANVPPPQLKVAEKYQDKVGHETDYSWITGHLFYLHTDGGKWVLRYTAVDEVDRFGGSVVLTPTVEMKNFREGDLVNVSGEVLNNGQAARPLGGALYRVNSIQLVERADSW
jgi:hypothetical protein